MFFNELLKSSMENAEAFEIAVIGLSLLFGIVAGRLAIKIGLPSIVGYMLAGVILGPTFLNIYSEEVGDDLNFITEIVLAFVAFSIGLSVDMHLVLRKGWRFILVLLMESMGAFLLAFLAIFIFTGDWIIALLLASIAPATAPAGTVAVIDECKARGSLSDTLIAVVGLDDGIGVIVYSLALTVIKVVMIANPGESSSSLFLFSIIDIFICGALGYVFANVFHWILRGMHSFHQIIVISVAFVLLLVGVCRILSISIILACLAFGLVLVNLETHKTIKTVKHVLSGLKPLLFVLFFVIAGAHLKLSLLLTTGALGIAYIIGRSGGKLIGASLGARLAGEEDKIVKFLGPGLLSQAGVAIGLALMLKGEMIKLGGDFSLLGIAVVTTITATSIFFEILGPIATRWSLYKSGEAN